MGATFAECQKVIEGRFDLNKQIGEQERLYSIIGKKMRPCIKIKPIYRFGNCIWPHSFMKTPEYILYGNDMETGITMNIFPGNAPGQIAEQE